MATGVITLITGCMFAGKSEELQRCLRRHKYDGGKRIGLWQLSINTRDKEGEVCTHDGNTFPAMTVTTFTEILQYADDYDVIGFDEAQFGGNLLASALQLADMGKFVYVAGLNFDYNCRPFINIAEMADSPRVTVIYCHAVCMEECCDNRAKWTQKIVEDTGRIQIGGKGDYLAKCTQHHPHWRES